MARRATGNGSGIMAPKRKLSGSILDELDLRILAALRRDGELTNVGIARQLGVSEGTIRNRRRVLVKHDYLRTVALANVTKLGYAIEAFITVEVEPEKAQEVCTQLASLPAIRWVGLTTGVYDLLAVALFLNLDQLSEYIVETIPKIAGIRKSNTAIVLRVFKRSYDYLGLSPDAEASSAHLALDAGLAQQLRA